MTPVAPKKETFAWPIEHVLTCDVLVIGSGVSGYCAAIQAGRSGCDVILIEKDEVLGGNSGPNLGVHITGADRYHHYGTETGIILQLQEESGWVNAQTQVAQRTVNYNIARRWEAIVQTALEEAGVRLLKRHYAKAPMMDGSRIAAVVVEDLATFQTKRIDVRHCVVEGSGDGEIAALAGADFRMGREARSEHGERRAPEQADNLKQGTSLGALVRRTDRPVIFVPPPGTPPFEPRLWNSRPETAVRHHEGMFSDDKDCFFLYATETGGYKDTIRDDGEIYEELLGQLWAEWDHIKNGPHAEEARNWDLVWVSPKAGKRESRRLLGDHILTETDVESGRDFPDGLAYGGYDVDMHEVYGTSANIVSYAIPPMYSIPLRSLYSRNISNLLLAGRLISATHIAHSTTRLMRTGATIGQAVGLTAAYCRRYGCTPREVHAGHLAELRQELLKLDGAVLHLRNEDPRDLARDARVTASSEETFNDHGAAGPAPLDCARGLILYAWPATIEAMEVWAKNDSAEPGELTWHVARYDRTQQWLTQQEYHRHNWRDLTAERFVEVGTQTLEVPAGHEGWLKVAFDPTPELPGKDETCDLERVLIWTDACPGLSLAWADRPCEIALGLEREAAADEWQVCKARYALRLSPPPLVGEAVNVLNGWRRRFSTAPTNMWISRLGEALPQSVTIELPEPRRCDTLHIVFDTLYDHYEDMPHNHERRVSGMCVREYEVEVRAAGQWQPVARETNNYRRLRIHQFARRKLEAVRLTIQAVWEPELYSARVYELRLYDQSAATPAVDP